MAKDSREPARPIDKFGDVARIEWNDVGKRLWTLSGKDHLSLIASGVAFNAFLAFVPFLTSVVLTYGIIASPAQVASHIAALGDALPEQAAEIIGRQLRNMVETAGSTTGLGLAATLAIALYGALRGASGIISGLNIIFEVEESRSFGSQTLVAIAITLGLILSFLLASLGISVLGMLETILPNVAGITHKALEIAFWIIAAGGVSVIVSIIYRLAPNRGDLEWRWLTPGSVLATGVWLVGTLAFGFYVRNFGNFQAIYGALGAVIIFLLWLYISAYILLMGAELNRVLQGKSEPSGGEATSIAGAREARP